jgi:hypothetical protein
MRVPKWQARPLLRRKWTCASDGAGRAHPWRGALVVLNQKDQRSYRLLADEVERAAMSPSKWRPALPRRTWR